MPNRSTDLDKINNGEPLILEEEHRLLFAVIADITFLTIIIIK